MKRRYTDNKDNIYEELLEDIINLRLKPGEYIKESDISERFNTSRTPIREVFKKLSNENYIDVIPRHGNKVALINLKYVKQMMQMRIVLESFVIKGLIFRIDSKDLKIIQENLNLQEKLVQENKVEEFFGMDNKFHQLLFNLDDKEIWWQNLRKFEPHYMRFRKLDMSDSMRLELLYVHHKNIVKAIEDKDVDVIDSIIKSHINICIERMPVLLDKYPDYFSR